MIYHNSLVSDECKRSDEGEYDYNCEVVRVVRIRQTCELLSV